MKEDASFLSSSCLGRSASFSAIATSGISQVSKRQKKGTFMCFLRRDSPKKDLPSVCVLLLRYGTSQFVILWTFFLRVDLVDTKGACMEGYLQK